jgi:hypothetical protein
LCRYIDKAGGLDRYLLKTPDNLLWSDVASDLKFRINLAYKQEAEKAMQQKLLELRQLRQEGQQQLQQQPLAPHLEAAGKAPLPLSSSSQQQQQ